MAYRAVPCGGLGLPETAGAARTLDPQSRMTKAQALMVSTAGSISFAEQCFLPPAGQSQGGPRGTVPVVTEVRGHGGPLGTVHSCLYSRGPETDWISRDPPYVPSFESKCIK